uniref:Cytoplasmic dynein 1 heavy chain 1 n=2 Tax=Plectus sambesii TaxID=2011161 RepID=A0A914WTV1_9BILA
SLQVAIDRNTSESTYRNLLSKLPEGQGVIEQAYTAVENLLSKVREYVGEWLRYQALWDLQPDMLYERLGTDLNKWMKTLVEIKKSRNTFDTQETRKEIPPLIVDYAKVQSKVSLKYDNWHREVLQKYGGALGVEMQTFFTDVSKSRNELEQQSVDAGTTSEAVGFITYVQGLKKQTKQWQDQVEMFREGQRLLSFQRFQFPTNWLYADNIEGEWSAFSDILGRKDSAIQTQVSNLQSKICQEDKVVENRTADVLADWEKNKPTEGSQKPDQALVALQSFEAKLHKLKEDRDNIVKAKDALELADTAQPSVHAEKLNVALEELQDLKGVWHALNPVYAALDEMKDKPWLSVQPRKLRSNLDALLSQLKELPSKYRSYESYDHAKRMMQNYARMNQIVIELKSEALKERHWKQMMKQLKVNWTLTDLTLGQVWDADLVRHEAAIKDIMLVAQGEMALEEFLKQVRESWQVYEIELVNYQNKTKLIKGWEDLFTKLKEHINSLAAMRLSPYYKEFEEDALAWEDKLNRVNTLFDVWIDVQRRWVYLEGIFSGSADIKTLLPVETGRFGSISTEFLGLMKKVSASPRVMEIVNFQGVQRLLERLADLLAKIQKALGEYLERERSSFPRFYFVGDEDLLEIIGNSKNIPRLQKHFKKMFAGVAAILLNEDYTIVSGLASREGEEIMFSQPVSIKENPRINDWLRRVESEMRNTLAKMLAQSVQDFAKFKTGKIDSAEYMQWLDRYPAQIIGITAQISWSEEIEGLLGQGKPVNSTLDSVNASLNLLADGVLQEQPPLRRKKLEHLITEFVHKRDITRGLIDKGVNNAKSFAWLSVMRFYFDPKEVDVLKRLSIQMANASFNYGFEYLGVQERLVQTPLTDRCYLTMTEALQAKLGGSPFGPAGTGKTETVKALGNQLGRFVLVFNCDETFDFQAMGRIFVGLCQVGAWGCFDEFNRLEERMLSAVSQQVQAIQETLRTLKGNKDMELSVDLVGKQVRVNPDMAIFITMNPGYAGRSNLPDNLKQLFRSLAMTQPDRQPDRMNFGSS